MRFHFLALMSCAAFIIPIPAPAQATETAEGVYDILISQLGDTEKSCGELSYEALFMRHVIEITQEMKDTADMKDHGITAAGAVGSFLVGTLTGGIGFAAAGFLASQVNDAEAEKAETLQDKAGQRRSLMVGIYNAKGCYGPIEHVLLDPEPEEIPPRLASVKPSAGTQTTYQHEQDRYNN